MKMRPLIVRLEMLLWFDWERYVGSGCVKALREGGIWICVMVEDDVGLTGYTGRE